jgi:hypothetical protein
VARLVAGTVQKMSEWDLVWSFPLKLIPTLLFALCYMWGGRTQKWVRRYVGPVLFTLSCAILAHVFYSFSPKIAILVLYAPVLTLGYNTREERLIYGEEPATIKQYWDRYKYWLKREYRHREKNK